MMHSKLLASARFMPVCFSLFAMAAALPMATPAHAQDAIDRYVDYYYPPITSSEEFARTMIEGPQADARTRLSFVNMITRAQLDAPDNPYYAIFAKGGNADKLIMVGLNEDMFGTLYQARALLAQLSSSMRGSPFFKEMGLETQGTFFDMLQLLGFQSLVITDGADWSHKITFTE